MMSHGGRPPSGDIEPPGSFEDALHAFKEAFTQWQMTSGAKTSTTCGPAKSACVVNWDADFAGLPPIELPDGRKLETLSLIHISEPTRPY